MVTYRCEQALVPAPEMGQHDCEFWLTGPVDITCQDGVISYLGPPGASASGVRRLTGLVVPAFADAHSHVFHRALRGRTHQPTTESNDFWSWRDQMYALAEKLQPDTLFDLAQASYAEMICAGVTAVGEFHYLHHQLGGQTYDNPNEMGLALAAAAASVGIDLTLLDTAYLMGGLSGNGATLPLSPVQQRFSDGSIDAWAQRVSSLPESLRYGVAIHSVRAVAPADMPTVVAVGGQRPLHVHVSEQVAENAAAQAAYRCSPAEILRDAGVLGPRTAAVHATHLSQSDITLIGRSNTTVVMCPATEADLADGIGPARELFTAGAPIALGSDQHVVTDPFAQARGLEYGERLATQRRTRFSPAQLWAAGTVNSHRAIGSFAGELVVGAPADFLAIRTDSARTAGSLPEQMVLTASAADITTVVKHGRIVAESGYHLELGDPGTLLAKAIGQLVSK